MREIKFRVWYNNTMWGWNDLYSLSRSLDDGITLSLILPDASAMRVHKNFKLMQYTGLKATNGDLYESDIVKINMGHILRDTLEIKWGGCWNYAGFGLHGKRMRRSEHESEWTWDALNPETAKHCEIIGNIYENPELLRE